MSELRTAAKADRYLAAEGAVLLIECIVPAIEQIDGSSGMIGSATRKAVEDTAAIVAAAADEPGRHEKRLERIYAAYQDDGYGYLDGIGDLWGNFCGSVDHARSWAEKTLASYRSIRAHNATGYIREIDMCLSAQFFAGQYDAVIELVETETLRMWHHERWKVLALAALDRPLDAIAYAESLRDQRYHYSAIDETCEHILRSIGEEERAYNEYALTQSVSGTYLAHYTALCKRYPNVDKRRVLLDLIARTTGDSGKWFAAANKSNFLDIAVDLAKRGPCDPKVLTRAAQERTETHPEFSLDIALQAIAYFADGRGFDVTSSDIRAAYLAGRTAAERLEQVGNYDDLVNAKVARGNSFILDSLRGLRS